MLNEDRTEGAKSGCDADAEATIAVQKGAGVAIENFPLFGDDEHGDFGAVLAFEENL